MIPIKDLGSVGFIPDQLAQELPDAGLSSVSNVRTRDGHIERIGGDTAIYTTPPVTPYFCLPYAAGPSRFLVYAGTAAVYADDGSTQTDITGTAPTGASGNRWTGGVLNGVLVLNNSIDQPMYWGGNTALNLATLTGWNSAWRCASLRPWKNYLFALDVTKTATRYPHMVKWSSAADPGTVPASWNEADPAVDAGELDLAETTDFLVDCLPLGDQLIIYKQFSMYAATYVGGQFIFSFRRIPGDSGLMAKGCVASVPGGQIAITNGDVIFTDGQTVKSIVSGRVRKWLFNSIDPTYYERAFVTTNPSFNEAWICYPTTGNTLCNRALVWNWADNTFTVRSLTNVTYGCSGQISAAVDDSFAADSVSFDESSTTFDQAQLPLSKSQLVLATSTPQILAVDVGNDFHGTGFTASIERTGLAFGDASTVKTARAVYPRIDGNSGSTIYIQLGATMDVEAPYTWADPVPYVIGSTFKADSFVTGRFIGYRIYSSDTFSWRARSIDFDVKLGGRY